MRNLGASVLVALLMLGASATAWCAGGGAMSSGPSNVEPERQRTPEELAKAAYNSGVRHLKDAKEYEEDAAKAADAKKIAKLQEKAQKAYQKALKDFTAATKQMPGMYEAWNYVGFSERHLGNYDASLQAYAKALELKPNYPEALEYRGEAFLGLNAIEDAKQTYLALFRTAPPLASQLMMAMHKWVDVQKQKASGDSAALEAFISWLRERETIASQSADASVPVPQRW